MNRYSSGSDVAMNESIHQAVLMQSYLKKHPIKKEITVYRCDPDRFVDRLEDIGDIHTKTSFMSTSESKNRDLLGPGELTSPKIRPREIKINLKKSGNDISRLNPTFQNQQDMLVLFGTKFKVVSRRTEKVNGVKLTKIEITEVE